MRSATEGWSQKYDDSGQPMLQFGAPKQGRPFAHFAELTVEQRAADLSSWASSPPPNHVERVETHYFTHYSSDPAEMTDLPAAGRGKLVGMLLPPLMSAKSGSMPIIYPSKTTVTDSTRPRTIEASEPPGSL